MNCLEERDAVVEVGFVVRSEEVRRARWVFLKEREAVDLGQDWMEELLHLRQGRPC